MLLRRALRWLVSIREFFSYTLVIIVTYIFLGSEQPNFEMRTGGLIETLTGAQILITACVLILMVIALLKAVWRNSDTIRMAAKRVWSDFLRFTRN